MTGRAPDNTGARGRRVDGADDLVLFEVARIAQREHFEGAFDMCGWDQARAPARFGAG
jgi:hypothetical protein